MSFSSHRNSKDLWLVTTRGLEAHEAPLKRRAPSPRIITDKILPLKTGSSSPPTTARSSLFGWDRHELARRSKSTSPPGPRPSVARSRRPSGPRHRLPLPGSVAANPDGNTPNGANPLANALTDRVAIDPALSSVRSSAGQQGDLEAAAAPDIRFPDETLAFATAPVDVTIDASQVATAAVAAQPASREGSLSPPTDDSKPSKDQLFSRLPELRFSHKLAERRRRKVIKDLFDELRDLLPAERGSKSSKWEILSKSIDYITRLKTTNGEDGREMERLPRDVDIARGGTGAFPLYHGSTIPQTYPGAATAAYTAPAPAPPAQPTPTHTQPAQP